MTLGLKSEQHLALAERHDKFADGSLCCSAPFLAHCRAKLSWSQQILKLQGFRRHPTLSRQMSPG